MAFTGNEGEMVSLEDASRWTSKYRNSEHFDGVNAIFYGINNLTSLLNQRACQGIRIYKAIDDDGNPVMVLVGADEDGNDMTDGLILERGIGCPPNCGGGSSLMG